MRRFGTAATPIAALGVAAALVVAVGCDGPPPPGACGPYADTPGTARIASIDPAPANEANCTRTPVRVRFDFTPSDPGRPELAARGVPLTIGAGYNPPQDWVVSSGLAV